MVARRIIPCLDVRGDRVVKGVRFRSHRDVGGIVELAARYRDEGADELVFYDITASPEGRAVDAGWVSSAAACLDIPFCVAGGIRSVADAERTLAAGADKISVNSPALENPGIIDALALRFGTQCVVAGIDSRWDDGDWFVYQYTGSAASTQPARRRTLEWVQEVQERGAGEIVLNCMSHDGTRDGYDLEQLIAVRAVCNVPLVASGGAGNAGHVRDVFADTAVDAALAASIFHNETVSIPALKAQLHDAGIEVRL
ncbi:MAG: imidazole glycerol phosphate synthase subunit HisF [Gammaproteobacteria bacterium]|nr:imidazole glycerol phosphate synthase subunit HisF [Gammaproteobacteria bacterium]NNF62303.1 imidazole glycerol phosphate synthase subunit HisF [Gammaproteobacteria bacterium]NNM21216.1 imidazole glycerol phosphate synthase subunit HisF [Gammaproteobacteria bacterium]